MSEKATAAPPAGAPPTEEELAQQLQVQVVDVSHGVAANAIDAADAYIAEQTSAHGFKGFVKRIWYGNLAQPYIRQREVQRGRQEIVETGNLYVLDDASQAEHDQAMGEVVDRFSNGYLHGEREDSLADVEHGQELEQEIRALIGSFASGGLDEGSLQEEKTRVMREYGQRLRVEDRNKGLLFADNIVEVARAAKAAFSHGVGLDRIDQLLSARKGEAAMGVRTEAHRDLTDRVVDKLYQHRPGTLVNETSIALAAGVAMTVARFTTRKGVTAAGALAGMGVGSAVIAGAREHARVGQERRLHSRQRAQGDEMPVAGAKRRESMEETRYETAAASDMTDQLTQAREALETAGPTGIAEGLELIAAVEARIKLSDSESIDLIDFSGRISVERERRQLDMGLAEAKAVLKHSLEAADDPTLQAAGVSSRDIEAAVTERVNMANELLVVDIAAKDRVFAKLRRNRTMKMAAVGFVSSMAIGEVIQEARAAFSDSLQGVFEQPDSEQTRRTLLASIFQHGIHHSLASHELNVHDTALNDHATVGLPPGYHLTEQPTGQWALLNNEGKPVASDLGLDVNGHFNEASQALLLHAGFHLNEHTQDFSTSHVTHETVTRSPDEYMRARPGEFTAVNRELWYDNNTPSVPDQNELRLDWGGQNGIGMDAHGNYILTVQHMTSDGSFQAGYSANAQQLYHEGKMAIALSVTRGTQHYVHFVPINAQGEAIIDAKSYFGRSLFENQNGQAHFVGAFAEAAQLMGKHNGVETTRMLATVVGDNQPKVATETITHVLVEQHERVITDLTAPNAPPLPIEVPFALPLYSRRGMETMDTTDNNLPYIYTGSGYIPEGYRSQQGLMPRRGLAPFAPELEADPNADIDADTTAKRYLRSLRPSYKRVVDRLSGSLDSQPKADHPKLVVMIPAAAHQEGRNIYRTLQQYALQKGVDPGDFEVVVFANYPDGAHRDQTISEVKRFQKEHPELNVRLLEKRLESKEANIGWIRKAATDSVITDLIKRNIKLSSVMLVSNDADSESIDPRYLQTIINKSEASPEVDGFLGFIDWSYEAYGAHPDMFVATRFMQMIETYLRISKHEIGSSGANFAFRPGMYAAVGGYKAGAPLAEDVMLGRMIKSVRAGAGGRRPIAFLGRSSEINTSARRALEKLFKDGGAPAMQWSDEFGTSDALRTRNFSLQRFDFNDQAAIEEMVRSTERMLNQTLSLYSGSLNSGNPQQDYRMGRLTMYDNETIRQINRICFFLGVKVDWQPDGSLKIVDADKMLSGLVDWQSRH